MDKVPLEAVVVKAIMDRLKREGYRFVYKTHGAAYQVSGLPDIVVIDRAGRFVGLECKRPAGGKLSGMQAVVLNRIAEAGGYAEIVTGEEEAMDALRRSEAGEKVRCRFCEGSAKAWRTVIGDEG